MERGLLIRLVYPAPGMPMSYALTLVDPHGRRLPVPSMAASADLLPVANLMSEGYRLRVEPKIPGRSECLAQWFDGAASEAEATPIELLPGVDLTSVTVRLVRGGVIRARVRRLDGRVSSGSCVLRGEGNTDCLRLTYNSLAGPIEFLGLSDGAWKLGIRENYYGEPCAAFDPDLWTWYGGASWDSAAVIVIRDHRTVEGLEIVKP